MKLQLQRERSVGDRQFKGPVDCLRQTIRAEGIFGLWRAFIGSIAFRSGFFVMFLGVEGLMRSFAHLDGTRFQVRSFLLVVQFHPSNQQPLLAIHGRS